METLGRSLSPLRAGCVAQCRGCHHRGWSLAASRAQKEAWLGSVLAPWADRLEALHEPEERQRLGYRDKVCLATRYSEGKWRFGLLHREQLIPIPACPVHSQRVRATVALLAPQLPPPTEFSLHWLIQAGAQVTLVLKSSREPPRDWLTAALWDALRHAGVEGLWVNLFPSAGRNRFSKRGWRLLAGQPLSLAESNDGQRGLTHGPAAFQQLIPSLYRHALHQAGDYLAPNPDSVLMDLYSGIGATLRYWHGFGATVLGVECSAEAVECAARNAPGVCVLRGRCAQRLPQLTEFLQDHHDRRRLAWVNPPRNGLETEVVAWLGARGRVDRLAYLSCSAGTLRRDLDILCAAGYRVDALLPYDFFPYTRHVETLALLRGNHVHHVLDTNQG